MKKRISEIYTCIPVFLITAVFCIGIAAACIQNASAQGTQLSADQLVDLVAPVALYPDDLLTNVLTASTIPDQVSQAAQYVRSRGGKVSSMPDTDWDPSVKALLYFPDVLYKMNNDLNWTRDLGNAVINQMNDVLAAVQVFRGSAYNAGNLKSTEQQKVVADHSTIIIEPSNPDVIYVPTYDPVQVVNTGHPVAAFAAGVAVADWWHYNNVDWYNRNVIVNPVYLNHYNYRPGGYYYNNLVPRPGYTVSNVWRPASRAGYDNVNRVGTTDVNRVRDGNVRVGNTVNINTGSSTVNRANTNTAGRVSTSDLNSRLQQGLRTTDSVRVTRNQTDRGGVFGGMNSGSAARAESQRGSVSRSWSPQSGGSINRGGGRRR